VFVHGALCVAYSGQCLTSEAIGGRSANRGACAQACRLPYSLVVDGEARDTGDRAFLLSPEDLEASALIPQLSALGVASVKIEGRLKADSYVAATTALYRQSVDAAAGDAAPPDEATRARALQMFTRGSGPGFLAGVDHQRLVDGSTCDHRGLRIATLRAVERMGGRTWLRLALDADLARGDGLLVQGARANEGEVGGRVWAITAGGLDVERAAAGSDARVWLGPERDASAAMVGHAVWRTNAPSEERAVRDAMQQATAGDVVDLVLRGRVGEPARLEAITRSGRRATVEGDAPIEAGRNGRTPDEVVRDKLGRLGGTTLRAGAITSELGPDAMVSPSSLNRLRRALVDALAARVTVPWATTDEGAGSLLASAVPPDRAPASAGLFVLCRTLPQAHAAIDAGADGVYLDFLELTGTGPAVRALRDRGVRHVALAPPRIRKPGEEKIDRYLASLAPDALLVRGLGALHESGSEGVPRIGDASLNVTNRITAATVLSRGLASFTPSFDLDAAQVMALLESPFGAWSELVVHHPMPLFHMEHCVIAARALDRPHAPRLRPALRAPPGLASATARAWSTPSRPTWAAATPSSTPPPRAPRGSSPALAARASVATASSWCARPPRRSPASSTPTAASSPTRPPPPRSGTPSRPKATTASCEARCGSWPTEPRAPRASRREGSRSIPRSGRRASACAAGSRGSPRRAPRAAAPRPRAPG
jgi:putative protease